MNEPGYLVNNRALASHSTLTPEERAALDRVIAPLLDLPEEQWGRAGALRLDWPEPLYFLRVDDSLRAYVSPAPGGGWNWMTSSARKPWTCGSTGVRSLEFRSMKTFESLAFDPARCQQEVGELRAWLRRRPVLDENKHIRPFFRKRRHLSAFLGSYSTSIIRFDRLAFEYPLFGDFTCDLAVGDSAKHAYSFIEFEDAGPNSLFVKQGRKATREWSARLDHGYGQIIDWFAKLDDMKKSDAFAARFGARSIRYNGVLIVGRDHSLQPGERERLEWRRTNVVVASQRIEVVTFDSLVDDLEGRLGKFLVSPEAGGRR